VLQSISVDRSVITAVHVALWLCW